MEYTDERILEALLRMRDRDRAERRRDVVEDVGETPQSTAPPGRAVWPRACGTTRCVPGPLRKRRSLSYFSVASGTQCRLSPGGAVTWADTSSRRLGSRAIDLNPRPNWRGRRAP